MSDEKKEESVQHVSKKKYEFLNKVKRNPWILSSILLGILALFLMISLLVSSSLTGKIISAEQAGEKLLNFYTELGVSDLTLISSKEVSGLYEVTLDYQGQEIVLYITRDGKNAIESLLEIEPQVVEVNSKGEVKSEDIPKSEKPTVDLYVMSFCPYGVRAENNVFPIIDLFKDKITFNIRFIANVQGDSVEEIRSLHGLYEAKENLRQIAINSLYPNKFYEYLKQFNLQCYQYAGDDSKIDGCWKQVAESLAIDTKKVETFAYGKEGLDLLSADESLTEEYSVSGSPTLIINGVKSDSIYTGTSSVQQAICSAFNTAPEECETELQTVQQTTSGSC